MSASGNIYNAFSNTNAFKQITIWEDAIFSGYAFSHKNNYTFTAAQTRKFLLSPICTSGGVPGFVPLLTSTAGPIEVDYYVNPTITNIGTSALIFNRNSLSSNVAQSSINFDTVTSNDGTWFSADLIPASSGGGAHASSGASQNLMSPFNFDCSKTYLMVVTNTNGSTATVNIAFNFAEI